MVNATWKALYVRTRFERFVASRLEEFSIPHYLPLLAINPRSQGIKPIHVPMFPQYVFCKCDEAVDRRLRYLPGVLAVFHGGCESSSDDDIQDLRRVVEAGVPIQPWPFVSGKSMVKVEEGPLCGVRGVLETAGGKRRLIISVHLIHRSVAVDLGPSGISVTSAQNSSGAAARLEPAS